MSTPEIIETLLDPRDSLERQNAKLRKITAALMRRVEQGPDNMGAAYAQFQRAAFLEAEVAARTRELGQTLELLNTTNTQLEAALAKAERANASKARFVAAASHDLLQPLSAAKLYLGSAVADSEDPKVQSVLRRADNALGSVEHLIGALLDISRLESDQAGLHLGQVPLGRLLTQLCDEVSAQAHNKGLDLRLVTPHAVVISDATYLRRILQNLIGNAVRYTERGKILIGVRHKGPLVRVEIHDTGPGIAEENRQTIFREFHRGDARHASAAEGLGLGLAIVERACAALSHPLHLRSTPGHGTCFAVDLPLKQITY
jgi:signal transduction histidine kinase